MLDKSINPYRNDIAAEKLRGLVDCPKFVTPVTKQIVAGGTSIKSMPRKYSEQASEAQCGETFDVYDVNDGYAWGQISRDNYVGYIALSDLSDEVIAPNLKIKALRTYGFAIPKVQGQVVANLSMNALVTSNGEVENGFVNCGRHGWIYQKHLAELNEFYSDPATVAQMYLGAPYYWGGVQSYGLDCSGLAQSSFRACGIDLPRDAYMQEKCGQEVAINEDLAGLQRNDLIFWKGHVGIMLSETQIIHANGWHMCVAIENLVDTNTRYLSKDLAIRSIRRIK